VLRYIGAHLSAFCDRLFSALSGQLNKEIVFKKYDDKIVVSKYPDMSKRKLSPKQIKNQEIMYEANSIALGIMHDEELSRAAQVRLNVTRNKLYTALIKEYSTTIRRSMMRQTVKG
jgi:hypothetical protein